METAKRELMLAAECMVRRNLQSDRALGKVEHHGVGIAEAHEASADQDRARARLRIAHEAVHGRHGRQRAGGSGTAWGPTDDA